MSDLAKRCGVAEARILDLNANIEGTKDLLAGMTLSLEAPSGEDAAARARQAKDSFLSRLRSYAKETERTIGRAAETARQSIEEFVQKNPDLHQRILRLGQTLIFRAWKR
ncbi:LysM peptidoglycan-binding domain-containing protein [Methylocystis echinoides]|uniref:LysM peptidoglycan-binding domain-containing protein n=1 Tax=Methylocystis echinoides TaxID=29468 RepID=UPI0038621C91